MKFNDFIRVYIPELILQHIDRITKENPPEIENFDKEKLLLILSKLYEIPAYNRKERNENGFVHLNATILRKYVSDYKKYLDYLIVQSIIDSDRYYIPGEKSYGFRINHRFVSQVIPNKITSKKLVDKANKLKSKKYTTQYQHLKKWFYGLEIDAERAHDYIRNLYESRIAHPEMRVWDPQRKKYRKPFEQYNSGLINIQRIVDQDFIFSVDKTAGRLHTNLTNMQSGIRSYLSYRGQKLVSIDITNSQPYLINLLFNESFYEKKDLRITKKITYYGLFKKEAPGEARELIQEISKEKEQMALLMKETANTTTHDVNMGEANRSYNEAFFLLYQNKKTC